MASKASILGSDMQGLLPADLLDALPGLLRVQRAGGKDAESSRVGHSGNKLGGGDPTHAGEDEGGAVQAGK